MKIFLAQHAEAVDKETDPERPISSLGEANATRVAEKIAENNVGIVAVRHSGKLRAKQTAEIYAEHVGTTDVRPVSGMAPNDNVGEFIRGLDKEGVLYVGHLPHLDKTLTSLLCGTDGGGVIVFKNAGIACVDIAPDGSSLLWYITPDIC